MEKSWELKRMKNAEKRTYRNEKKTNKKIIYIYIYIYINNTIYKYMKMDNKPETKDIVMILW